ncbi:MAG: hypothetical protein K0S73_2634 [Stenotrophomonas rhizophila]|nr:hypothetical protein [Stenotrophomonas rhizophila]
MSKDINTNPIVSESELLDWLRVKPRTFGWDALLAYDRFQANRLLLQEYIQRHSSEEDAFERVSGRMLIVAGKHWSYFNDFVLDSPRLSFERSTVDNSLASLTLRITGGSHLTVVQEPNGPRKVERIDWYDPLQGPKLIAGIRLNDADGSVSQDGRVRLDLSAGLDMRLTLGTSDNEQEEAGRFFQQRFDKWPDDKKYLVLNEFGSIEGAEFLNPDQFRVRAIPAPGANVRTSGHYGDGAVACFVSSVGSEVGLTPDKDSDLRYLIPDGKSATVLIGNYYLIKTLMGSKVRTYMEANFTFNSDSPMSAISSGEILSNDFRGLGWVWSPYPPFEFMTLYDALFFVDQVGVTASFVTDLGGGAITLHWAGENDETMQYNSKVFTGMPSHHYATAITGKIWDFKRSYRFNPTGNGAIGIEEVAEDSISKIEISLQTDSDPALEPYLDQIRASIIERIRWVFPYEFGVMVDTTAEIDLFRLHGLLFKSDVAVNLSSAHFPCDLAAFGQIAPGLTAFAIEPMEDVIAAGASISMKTVPHQQGLTWKVESVAGFEGGTGSIDSSGLYRAPSAGDVTGNYTLVRITASTAEANSSALMRVVLHSVSINPLVVTASSTSGKIQMSAGTVDGGELSWSIESATGATLTDVPPDEGEYDEWERFYVPGPGSSGKLFSVDEVTVTNPRLGDSSISLILRTEKGLSGKVYIADLDIAAGRARLEFDNNMGPISGVTWEVIAGGGSIDSNGVFTVDEHSPHKFAVVTAYFLIPGVAELSNFIILPVPLIDLDKDDSEG